MSGGFPCGPELCNANDAGSDTANSRGTAVTCGNSAYGSYVQLVASTPADTSMMLVQLTINGSVDTGNQVKVKIAVGAAAAEKDIVLDIICHESAGAWGGISVFLPIAIPAGTRLSAAAYETSHTDSVYVSVILFDSAYSQMEGGAGAFSIGVTNAVGVTVTTGVANTKGSYAQVTASLSNDIMGFVIVKDGAPANGNYLLDIAIGAAASEQVIIPNLLFSGVSGGVAVNAIGMFFPVPIPQGTRIAARAQSNNATQSINISLIGVYQ